MSDVFLGPKDPRVVAYENLVIKHPILEETYKSLQDEIRYAKEGAIIFLFGPTGIGKTTLMRYFMRKSYEAEMDALYADPGLIPFVMVEAVSPGSCKKFSWLDFNRRALQALAEPLVQRKVQYKIECVAQDGQGKIVVDQREPEHALKRSLEQTLQQRKVKALLIDEAQHIGSGCRTRDQLYSQLEYIKSFSNLSKTAVVLIGTYDLIDFFDHNDQAARRSKRVHFPRYSQRKAHMEDFTDIICWFIEKMPLEVELDIDQHFGYLYDGSFGCVGLLKSWFDSALTLACEGGAKKVTIKHFEATEAAQGDPATLYNALVGGERKLAELKDKRGMVRELLALERGERPPAGQCSEKPEVRRKRLAPGVRKPKRDPIGSR